MLTNERTITGKVANDQVNKPDSSQNQSGMVQPPSLSLPKGGGAIRGMGEKFAANPVTGTGSISVPIATSPGRSGFGPQLSLSYDSGAGNGPFGFGWNLSLPSITRKTDKGLPQYFDGEESDIFILSGAEDLVPLLNPDGSRFIDTTSATGYTIHRYRPRIEGLFARIERWTRQSDGDVHWRSISRDNILTLYGKESNARIVAANDSRRIFSWLICETRDDKGNAVLYEYKEEDGTGVDLTLAHERNRGDQNDPRRKVNRYLKHITYGNRVPLLDGGGARPRFLTPLQINTAGWMFEVVFDYGEHDSNAPKPDDAGPWTYRADPFSSYRAGFEVRTGRLCQRVLMFHHFVGETGVGNDCLVRSTDFTYSHQQEPSNTRNPVYTFLRVVTQSGYKRDNGGYLKRSLPAVEYEYSQPIVQDTVQEVDATSLENLPIGVDGATYQWTDLHGEGIPGILSEQGGAWFYKRNLSPISRRPVELAPLERVAIKPNLALAGGQAQFMDLAGDGQPDLVVWDGPMPGFYEHDGAEGWETFRPFTSRLHRDLRDPNLKFVDLDGDGHADVLISEDDAFVWHASLAELGFGPARRVYLAVDEEKGPRLVFADGSQSIYLADLNGDGLTDLLRIRNGAVCYWPNLGYGRFGAKVTMDHAPWFDNPDQFDQKRIRLADIDGSGTTDIIYLHRDGVRLYFNQSGNSWSKAQPLNVFPRVDDLVAITPTDLFGNGTACLVWSSPLSGDGRRQMRYVDLMGGQKPHLLIKMVNNLGAETHVHYAPSTKFYLQDKRDGKPWISKLPFPVHVVERVESLDAISGNRFVTRYAYHHGYFDGEEREFRGFGMVEQFDTEEFAALTADGILPAATNLDAASHVPPVLSKSWFHTGVYLGREHVSDFFAGLLNEHDAGEYYREPGLSDAQAKAHLLPDTIMPPGLTLEEEREACRALKGAMLRQEVYALDGSAKAEIPYAVSEQNFTIQRLQPHDGNRHAVFFTHPREALSHHYERNPADPRSSHALTLEVDLYGNVLKQAAIGYGRRKMIRVVDDLGVSSEIANPGLNVLGPDDQKKQTRRLITYSENRFAKDPITGAIDTANDYRTPLPGESRTYELTGFEPDNNADRFSFDEWTRNGFALPASATEIPYTQTADDVAKQKRLIEQVRTVYRKGDLSGFLPLGELNALALPGESYKLSFTPGLLAHVFKRKQSGQPDEDLLPTPAPLLEGKGADQGGYVAMDGNWWIPAGRVFYSDNANHSAGQELAMARAHFFLPRRYRDPFGHDSVVSYDGPVDPNAQRYDLLVTSTSDALGNSVTAINDYRVLQPWLVSDPNGNRSTAAFDGLGMVVATAVRGKESESLGDLLEAFNADPPLADLQAFIIDPQAQASSLLGKATTRIVYDLARYQRTGQPPFAATLARETHFFDPLPTGGLKIQLSFSYSDGFGREIQKKMQAEAGDAPQRQAPVPLPTGDIRPGDLVRDAQGKLVQANTARRWVGSGRTVFNNKGKPVRQYEPFFSATQLYEAEREMTDSGVSPILFYDPVERVVATLHPNHTYEKVVFDSWQQTTYDVNDTVTFVASSDANVRGFLIKDDGTPRIPTTEYLPAWHAARIGNPPGDPEREAAQKAAAHADTPTIAHFDALGRPFLTAVHNRYTKNGAVIEGQDATRVEVDIEGNQRSVSDALGRSVMHYEYDMLGTRIKQASIEAGARWILNNVAGKPIRAWDDRRFIRRMTYDALHRLTGLFVTEPAGERLAEQTIYGEAKPLPADTNHRGKVWQVRDDAGIVTSETYDFKGSLLSGKRDLRTAYQTPVNWAQNPAPATSETFNSSSKFDAVGRVIEAVAPDGSVTLPRYNEANLLEAVDVRLRGAAQTTPFVRNIDYNAKGQRIRIEYNKDDTPILTEYTYDPATFRLTHLVTSRPNHPEADKRTLQDLHYTYDPASNITHIQDDAQQTIYFRNQRVEPSNDYVYDAIYRLISAQGREHLGQTGGQRNPPTAPDAVNQFHSHLDHPGNGDALGRYVEEYEYDAVGNFKTMQHRGSDPVHPGWTRSYTYNEPSLLEPTTQKSNRLSSTQVGAGPLEAYTYDAHGNMTSMPHLPTMRWDFEDQLTQVDLQGGGTAYYVYDAGGQRVRKVIERNGATVEERIYLGGYEVYRKRQGAVLQLERQTLHIMDDKQRIALVETRTQGNDPAPQQLIRYQFGNHLDSASLELDDAGQIISYEEYFPYGSTSYQAVRSQMETPKRYRYTGKERDEESRLYYHEARYYEASIGRWTSCEPKGLVDGQNLYAYARSNPIKFTDPNGNQSTTPPPLRLPRTAAEGQTFLQQVTTQVSAHPNTPVVFRDSGVSVVVMRLPEPYVVTRGADQTFTSAAQASNTSASETVINTNLYESTTSIPRGLTGPADPSAYRAQGQVVSGGSIVGGRSSPNTFHFAWTRARPQQIADQRQQDSIARGLAGPPAPSDPSDAWQFGQGDPPRGADVAFGGGIPVIIGGLPFGTENQYASGAPAGLPRTGDPGAGNQRFLTQRSNAGFSSQEAGGNTLGKVVVGIERESNLLILVVQEHGSTGMRLSEVRDSLIHLGVDDALAWDGSDSATLVRDATVDVSPGRIKNNTIPSGAGFRLR